MDVQDAEIGRARSQAPLCDPPPSADTPYEERAAWSDRYLNWVLAETPQQGVTPTDVRATHRYEIEFNSCVADPEAYARAIEDELQRPQVH
jgi:hypothetical protein